MATKKCSFLAGAGDTDLAIEGVSDFDLMTVDVKLCAVRITNIGSGLPCMNSVNMLAKQTYGRSVAARKYDDWGMIDVGSACPVNYPDGGSSANQFRASVYFM